jgi:hypothetical protein
LGVTEWPPSHDEHKEKTKDAARFEIRRENHPYIELKARVEGYNWLEHEKEFKDAIREDIVHLAMALAAGEGRVQPDPSYDPALRECLRLALERETN